MDVKGRLGLVAEAVRVRQFLRERRSTEQHRHHVYVGPHGSAQRFYCFSHRPKRAIPVQRGGRFNWNTRLDQAVGDCGFSLSQDESYRSAAIPRFASSFGRRISGTRSRRIEWCTGATPRLSISSQSFTRLGSFHSGFPEMQANDGWCRRPRYGDQSGQPSHIF